MDRLIEAIEAKGNPSAVGLDPTPALLPGPLLDEARLAAEQDVREAAADVQNAALRHGDDAEAQHMAYVERWQMHLGLAYLRFNMAVIDAVADVVPAVKPQVAMYEALGPAGMAAYRRSCQVAHDRGLYVIGDVKRGDIGSTATAYAAHLAGTPLAQPDDRPGASPWFEDAVTVNPYLGTDGVAPFTKAARRTDRDLFALVRTSNPSGAEIQELTVQDGRRVYEHVADLVGRWGRDDVGTHGYSRVGAVVGATHPQVGAALRRRMPHTMFLVPGYGAQGGRASDVAAMFDAQGSGAIISSSRGIIGSWLQKRYADRAQSVTTAEQALRLVADAARDAVIEMRNAIRTGVTGIRQ